MFDFLVLVCSTAIFIFKVLQLLSVFVRNRKPKEIDTVEPCFESSLKRFRDFTNDFEEPPKKKLCLQNLSLYRVVVNFNGFDEDEMDQDIFPDELLQEILELDSRENRERQFALQNVDEYLRLRRDLIVDESDVISVSSESSDSVVSVSSQSVVSVSSQSVVSVSSQSIMTISSEFSEDAIDLTIDDHRKYTKMVINSKLQCVWDQCVCVCA